MMPPPTASLKPSSNGTKPTDSSAKIEAAAAPSNGSSSVDKSGQPRLTKPDQAAYNAQMDELNKEIEGVKAELVSVWRGEMTMGRDIEGGVVAVDAAWLWTMWWDGRADSCLCLVPPTHTKHLSSPGALCPPNPSPLACLHLGPLLLRTTFAPSSRSCTRLPRAPTTVVRKSAPRWTP